MIVPEPSRGVDASEFGEEPFAARVAADEAEEGLGATSIRGGLLLSDEAAEAEAEAFEESEMLGCDGKLLPFACVGDCVSICSCSIGTEAEKTRI